VTPEQIRAAAAQAAAILMAPVQPHPADFLATAEVIETYIASGRNAAFAAHLQMAETIELLVQPEEPQAEPELAPVIESAPQDFPAAPVTQRPELAAVPERHADVISLPSRGEMSSKQAGALDFIEKNRKARVKAIMNEASVAKIKAHKERLLDAAEEAGLLEYPVVVDRVTTTVGAYLRSLVGS
jgi:hypothetical protein